MSDETTPPTPKTAAVPAPGSPRTSAVPLKKETVRITLRARPGAGVTQPREATAPVPTAGAPDAGGKRATAPIALPSAPLPPPSPKASTGPVPLPPAPIPPPGRKTMQVPAGAPSGGLPAPSAPQPPAPAAPMAPSAPAAPRPPVAPRPPGAPAAPMAPVAPSAPRVETAAATQPLTAAPRPPVAAPRPPAAASTGPMGAGPTQQLPKATQKLQATQPMARPTISAPPSAPVKRSAAAQDEQFYEEKDPDAGMMPISALCLVLALALLGIQMLSTDRLEGFTSKPGDDDPLRVPAYQSVKWETRNPDTHESKNTFDQMMRSADYEVPQ